MESVQIQHTKLYILCAQALISHVLTHSHEYPTFYSRFDYSVVTGKWNYITWTHDFALTADNGRGVVLLSGKYMDAVIVENEMQVIGLLHDSYQKNLERIVNID